MGAVLVLWVLANGVCVCVVGICAKLAYAESPGLVLFVRVSVTGSGGGYYRCGASGYRT